MNENPLLDFSGLPRFDLIQPAHVAPAIRTLLAEHRALVERLCSDAATPTWDGFVQPMTDAGERLSRAWGVVGHLHSVNDVPPWRDAYNAMLPEVSGYYAELGQNLALFERYKALAQGPEFATLTPARRKVIENELRDFRLSGAELPEDKKPRFKAIQEELSALSAKFSENLLDATNAHAEWVIDEAGLAGLPDDVVAAARAAAEKEGRPGWKFTLHAPSFGPVMDYAENRDLRGRLYRAYATRASEISAGAGEGDTVQWDNAPLIERMLELRAEESAMLGFANFAELSLVPKMADTPRQVADFLRDLARRARPYAERDKTELLSFAKEKLGLAELDAWDRSWASEKLKQARYAYSDKELKEFFPESRVLTGLIRVIEALFGVRLKQESAPVWHPDVRFYRIERDGKLLGQFYLDLYARDTKRGGAWMDEAVTRRRVAKQESRGDIQTPVAYLNCNFSAPVGEGEHRREATFSHDEVLTLFHECGHGLHHLLTEIDELPVSGIHGVEWDAVELPSQFMENFCWEWDVLQGMTAHIDTGQPLPRELYDKMIAAKNYQSGLMMLRQIEFSLFDLVLHSEFVPGGSKDFMDVLHEVRREVAVFLPPDWARFPQSFSHIFGGGYAAGYYSYKWAEVLSADAYAAFEEAAQKTGSTLDAATGERFRKEVLAMGGARPAMESFIAFRGRPPSPEPLLRHNGMAEMQRN